MFISNFEFNSDENILWEDPKTTFYAIVYYTKDYIYYLKDRFKLQEYYQRLLVEFNFLASPK